MVALALRRLGVLTQDDKEYEAAVSAVSLKKVRLSACNDTALLLLRLRKPVPCQEGCSCGALGQGNAPGAVGTRACALLGVCTSLLALLLRPAKTCA